MVKYDRLDMWQITIDLPSVYQKTFKSRMKNKPEDLAKYG